MVKGPYICGRKSNFYNTSFSSFFIVYCICLIFGLLFGFYGIIQNQFLPSHITWIVVFTYILPAYSLFGVAFRLRDAIATTLVSLAGLLLTDGINSIYVFVKYGMSLIFVTKIIICMMWVFWIVYFVKSKSVELYYPKNSRKISDFDWRLFIVYAAFCLVLNSTKVTYISHLMFNMKEYQEIVGKSSQIRVFNDSQIKYWDCTIEGDVCNVYFSLEDKSLTRYDFFQNLERPYFSYELLCAVNSTAPEFIRSIINHNLALVFNVFYKDISDRRVFNISSDQIYHLIDPEPQEDLTPVEMQ